MQIFLESLKLVGYTTVNTCKGFGRLDGGVIQLRRKSFRKNLSEMAEVLKAISKNRSDFLVEAKGYFASITFKNFIFFAKQCTGFWIYSQQSINFSKKSNYSQNWNRFY